MGPADHDHLLGHELVPEAHLLRHGHAVEAQVAQRVDSDVELHQEGQLLQDGQRPLLRRRQRRQWFFYLFKSNL